ncbi:zinc transporter ZntB [Rhodobacteraceae bacterium KMM 6894]|nr:zinc transporter ZntB [Rhodobacteraceae bacterium KMM 6894]
MQKITAWMLDGKGGGLPLSVDEAAQAPVPEGGFLWVHSLQTFDEDRTWLTALGGDPFVVAALMADETRPRCTLHEGGVLMNLRGVNLNPGAEPEDMVSLRIWAGANKIVTLTRRPILALDDIEARGRTGNAPASVAEMIAQVALRLADRAEPVVAELNEQIDDLEDDVAAGTGTSQRSALSNIRRVSIMLRRYMFPQRDALSTLEIEALPWVSTIQRAALREATERVTRLAEELDAIRDRAQVVHDHLIDLRAEAMNRQMLVLSVVTAVFLPLGLITGLLGINVGGIPGESTPHAFWIVSALLLGIGAVQMWVFARMGWLRRG